MYHHARSGLNLTMFRAYNPAMGRWLSRDPVGESMGANLYAYVGNNPINRRDPLGLYVEAEYSQSKHTLTARDTETGATFSTDQAFSGNQFANQSWADFIGGKGPIAQNDYWIEKAIPIHGEEPAIEYPLTPIQPLEGRWSDLWPFGHTRGGFTIHPGLRSNGCVTLTSDVPETSPNYPKSKAFDQLSDILSKTKPLSVNGIQTLGRLHVVP